MLREDSLVLRRSGLEVESQRSKGRPKSIDLSTGFHLNKGLRSKVKGRNMTFNHMLCLTLFCFLVNLYMCVCVCTYTYVHANYSKYGYLCINTYKAFLDIL